MTLDRWHSRREIPGGLGSMPADAVPQAGRVSVIVPLYNHEAFISEAIESILAQGPLMREIVVVDDGSSDGSASIVEALSRSEPRIVCWSQPNRGAHAAINAGLLRATGDILAILNSDDAYGPGRLAALTAALDADPQADLAASGLAFLDDSGEPLPNPWHAEALQFFRSCGDMALALINGNFLMTTSNYVFRRTLIDEIGLFAGLRYAHDLDFALRVLARGRRVALIEEKLLHYRMHPGNTIREDHAKVRLEWAAVTAFFLTTLWDRPSAPPVDWRRATAVAEILDRHRLTRAVHLCMTYFRRHASGTIAQNPFLSDPAFHELIRDSL